MKDKKGNEINKLKIGQKVQLRESSPIASLNSPESNIGEIVPPEGKGTAFRFLSFGSDRPSIPVHPGDVEIVLEDTDD